MKRLLLLLCALPVMAIGQTNKPQTTEELRLIEKIYYDQGIYIASEKERDKLNNLIFEMRADSTLKVHIMGFSDKWGSKAVNDRFSHNRAKHIADWMRSCRVPREQITFAGGGVDTLAVTDAEARRVEILQMVKVIVEPQPKAEAVEQIRNDEEIAVLETIVEQVDNQEEVKEQPITTEKDSLQITQNSNTEVVKPIEEVDTVKQLEPEPTPIETTTPTPIETKEPKEPKETFEPQPSPKPHSPRFLAIKSNLLQLGVGVFNGGLEYGFAEKFSVDLPISYSPYTILKNWRIRTLMVQPEFRYWLDKPFSGHFFGAHAHTGYFNISTDKQDRHQNSPERPLWGCGVSYGYAMNLYKGLKIEFNLGVGYANIKYDTFYNIDNGAAYNLNQQRDYWGITRAGVSLIYMFNLK